ncbi:hypothetical protein [Saccharomonospora glauca]|jgi:hypothetical protein|uniref:Rho termination factor n=1 Tax=Saccharomonospora glauca K62 TaxID=928724 RepID=I1CZR8_9PSEU|nr:hypothetical protein [Saccharomonospora glauca]EIE98192.1 hypothetical protein SacglDRAFT_01261 [Saccharomonospora glauca K62]
MPDEQDLHDKTLGELAETAHREGIPFVAHMSQSELVEAIEQQREANELQSPRPRRADEEPTAGRPTPTS